MDVIPSAQAKFAGCLLGGAVGDALGAPVEFMTRQQIIDRFGDSGICEYAEAYGGLGTITDDTQMTLFTAEGLLRGFVRGALKGVCHPPSVVSAAYIRWLLTQGQTPTTDLKHHLDRDLEVLGWLYQQPELHHQRAPGNTCLLALARMPYYGALAENDSKGCGGVMRVAPVGLFAWPGSDGPTVFQQACEIAAITHAHPSGILPAGVLAQMILLLLQGLSLTDALCAAKKELNQRDYSDETLRSLELAENLAGSSLSPSDAVSQIGRGWVAEEALAISVYCALVAKDFRHGVDIAVNHDGDSDSTGSITGNILGVIHGIDAIPSTWLAPLELRGVISEIATDLLECKTWDIDEDGGKDYDWVWRKYPGC